MVIENRFMASVNQREILLLLLLPESWQVTFGEVLEEKIRSLDNLVPKWKL